MNIDTSTIYPVYAYNSEGKKHLAPFEVIQAIESELKDAEEKLDKYNQAVKEGDYELQSDRDTQEGFVLAYQHVLRYLTRHITERQFLGI